MSIITGVKRGIKSTSLYKLVIRTGHNKAYLLTFKTFFTFLDHSFLYAQKKVHFHGVNVAKIRIKKPLNRQSLSKVCLLIGFKYMKLEHQVNLGRWCLNNTQDYKHFSSKQPSFFTPSDSNNVTILVLPVSRTIRMISTSARIFLLMSAPFSAKYLTMSVWPSYAAK